MAIALEFTWLQRVALATILFIPLFACKMTNNKEFNEVKLPLFNPHRSDFSCVTEAEQVPLVDAQAESWFMEARALEDPLIYESDRDYKKVVQLTRQAADRHHWKAMLNLASLYLENRDPPNGPLDARKLVEDAMRLNIPAAYDRMGTYYMNGTGVNGDISTAFAFFQRAAEMGSPQAMTFLAHKFNATWDNPNEGFWANIPVARKMLECALGQGYGPAAYDLHFLYARTRAQNGEAIGNGTKEEKMRAFKTLHLGAMLGCADCASKLSSELRNPIRPNDSVAPSIDIGRSERYEIISDALSFNPDRRYPNLDQVIPLPPAKLPPWNGDTKTLLDAAMGVSVAPPVPKPSAAAQFKGRHFVAAEFKLRQSGVTTTKLNAPAPAYWSPTTESQDLAIQSTLAAVPPGLYLMGETFDRFYMPNGGSRPISDVIWKRWDTIRQSHEMVDPQSAAGLTRKVLRPQPLQANAEAVCPHAGVWQPWIDPDHRFAAIVNQPWRQTWLIAGAPFPRAEEEWLLELPASGLSWHLMDAVGINIG